MTWIKIDADNLPDNDQTCFVYVPVGKSAYRMIDTFDEHDTDKWLEDYTHYMPLVFPEPPKIK